VRTQEP